MQMMTWAMVYAVALSSCMDDYDSVTGFDTTIQENSKGESTLEVDASADLLVLEGEVKLDRGSVRLVLLNPSGRVVYDETVLAPIEVTLNQALDSEVGKWSLQYESIDGKGYLDVHVYTKSVGL